MPTTVKIRRSGTASATPSALEHGEIAINYADGKVFWKNASNVITSFTFQSYALASHTHSISDVTGLQTALDGKASSSHTHSISDVTGLQAALDGKASSSHTHGNITNAGAIGSTADQFVVTTTSGVLTAVSAATARTTLSVQPTASPAFTGAATFANTGDVVPLTVTNAGTANSFVVNDASGDTTPFVIDAAGNVGIQSTSASYSLQIQRDAAGIPADSYVAVWGNVSGSNGTTGGVRFFNRQGNADATPSKQIAGVYAGRHGDNFGGSLTFLTANASTGTQTLATRLTIDSTGTATFAGQILADDIDTANSVAYGFDSDPDTGIGRGGANVLTLVTGGVEAVTVNSGQMLLCRKGFALQGEARPSSGAGLEVNYVSASNAATIGAYDRTNNVYKELHLFGSVIDFQIGAGSDMQLNASGELLIGTTSDNGNYKLQVNSQIYATNATIATSDARFKTNFESLTDATSVIESLRPVAFDFIPQTDRNFATERQVGLIAQEAQAALAGTDYADSVVAQCGDHLGLAYEKLVPVLIKALQESNARIAALEERING